jgi:alkanesulfonate monooxygenase SsuD/methylene tetrahydromethanopterin reductase-like flavin-dependent oxidoreductase (luciferase family)
VRHAVCLANFGTYADPRVVGRVAEAAEAAGWDGLFVSDHLAFTWGPPAGDPWVLLTAAACSTERLVLGTSVTPLARRRPHLVAQTVATLDLLSGGDRLVFGAGLGGAPSEFTKFGEPDDPKVRAEKLDEGLELLRRLWSGEEVTHRGRHYVVDGVTLSPVPTAPVPIWIGGRSPAALRRAAGWDGWIPDTVDAHAITVSPDEFADKLDTVRSYRTREDTLDVAFNGYSDRPGEPVVREYADAGVTWWVENFHDMRGSLDEALARVEAGP